MKVLEQLKQDKSRKAIKEDLGISLLFIILNLLLSIWDINNNAHTIGAFMLGFPFGFNLCAFLCWNSKEFTEKTSLIFKIENILSIIILFTSISAFAFEKSWYIYGLIIAAAINVCQIYILSREKQKI
ncbi:MAG: hypothetical protein ACI4LA_05375 [Emergencia sp.]